jgi:hypothetical protein
MKEKLKETAGGRNAQRLRESNSSKWDKMQNQLVEAMRRQVKNYTGLDIAESETAERIDFSDPSFSIKAFREATYEYCRRSAREASAEGVLQQLLRAGVQLSVNKEYQAVDTNFEEIVNVIPSTKAIELYAPLYRAGFMGPVEEGDEPGRVNAAGADIQIRNKKKAVIFEVTEEMWEDDQTSQIQEQASQIGENGKILKDSYCFVRWLGAAGTDAGGNAIPKSQTGTQAGESTWPFNTSFTNGGGQNRLTSFAAFSQQALIQLRLLGRKMKDPRGNKMLVAFDTLVCGAAIQDAAEELLTSQNYASTSSIKGVPAGAVGTDTGVGTTFARNILQGKYNLVPSIWLPDTCYGLMQAGKGLRLQQRRPLRVIMENPLSGPAFTASVFRYKIDERYEVDWTEPRFAGLGSDGTV